MLYQALATDFDGTIASAGKVESATYTALKAWQKSGRKLILVTGRRLDSLYQVFPQAKMFDCIVAENGALLTFPAIKKQKLLGSPPPDFLIDALQQRLTEPLSVGQGIIATRTLNVETIALIIKELDLAWQISYNKGAVMLLPKGVDKDFGLKAALNEMNLLPQKVVGVGDAENDIPLLNLCGLSVSVANALPVLKNCSDWVMTKNSGDGVVELIDRLLQE